MVSALHVLLLALGATALAFVAFGGRGVIAFAKANGIVDAHGAWTGSYRGARFGTLTETSARSMNDLQSMQARLDPEERRRSPVTSTTYLYVQLPTAALPPGFVLESVTPENRADLSVRRRTCVFDHAFADRFKIAAFDEEEAREFLARPDVETALTELARYDDETRFAVRDSRLLVPREAWPMRRDGARRLFNLLAHVAGQFERSHSARELPSGHW